MVTSNQRVFALGGAWLCAGFALLIGCSASDSSSSPLGESQNELRKPTPQPPRHGRPAPKPQPGHGHGNGYGHGHGHGHGHGPCNHPGHGTPGTGSGGSGNSSAGSTSSAGSASGGNSNGSGGSGTSNGGFGGGSPAVCGDGQYGDYEQCDDGNAVSGDGCSSSCQLEPNYWCGYPGAACTPVVCGDGQQQGSVLADGTYVYEGCDDGNAVAGDGCNASCNLESGWICEQPGTACRQPVCGDSRQDSWFVPGPGGPEAGAGGGSNGGTYYYEECDDGNSASGDGCTSSCTIEAGWLCPQPGQACHEPVCGDGFVDFIPGSGGGGNTAGSGTAGSGTAGSGTAGFGGGVGGGSVSGSYEACDDGNTVSGDGCNAVCSVEAGWACDYWQGSCHRTVCGDGLTDYPAEECDDGNTRPNDGCARDCTWENQGGFGGGGFGGGSAGVPGGGFGGGGFGGVASGGVGGTR